MTRRMQKERSMEKAALQNKKSNRVLKRGDVYYADLGRIEKARGSEQAGRRPVLVIQNDIGNRYAPTTIVAVLTSRQKRCLPTHVSLPAFSGLGRKSTVCLEQIKTIDKSRLGRYCGNIGADAMQEVGKALAVSLGTER